MRLLLVLTFSLTTAVLCRVQGKEPETPDKRYNQTLDLKKYPQDTPKTALLSLIKAIENKDVEYILAHLAEPKFVDQRVTDLGGKFDLLVEEAKGKLVEDPGTLKLLKRFAADGDWKTDGDHSFASLPDVAGKQVNFIQRKDRWYLENRNQPDKPKLK
jgi:hypothetical protein